MKINTIVLSSHSVLHMVQLSLCVENKLKITIMFLLLSQYKYPFLKLKFYKSLRNNLTSGSNKKRLPHSPGITAFGYSLA